MKRTILTLLLLPCLLSAGILAQEKDSLARELIRLKADSLFNGEWFRESTGYNKRDSTTIDTIILNHKKTSIRLMADSQLGQAPMRESLMDSLERGIMSSVDSLLPGYRLEIHSGKKKLRDLVPNYHRIGGAQDPGRKLARYRRKSKPLVSDLSRPWLAVSPLHNKYIALWHSHGWYYEPALHRWEWQRARIFQTVEDIYPMAYTLQMLVPMLENAGANVLMPRERDWQVNEVIVDNDGSSGRSIYLSANPGPQTSPEVELGFAIGLPPYENENPFRLGTCESMPAAREAGRQVQWIPDIPAEGSYAVYITYHASAKNADDASYLVHHAGGVSEFRVNQQMGGGTWIYLGRFEFDRGLNPESGKVVLSNRSEKRRAVISADAVRFGGGMGNIERHGLTGMRPRYQEAARYYLQYAGFPDSLVWKLNDPEHDYKDDYQGRGEWVSYLLDEEVGLGIPVDLSFAFHTDAGITHNDTVVGTLGIFSTTYKKRPFPNGLSRMSSRDLCDLVQSQVVEDLRTLYDPAWTRRGLWDKAYSEAFRPEAPAMLLELLSHQNFLDARFGNEPMYRFHVSRSIYKGMLRFISTLHGSPFIVQPLPVDHFATAILSDSTVRLSWKAVEDPLEPTATPDSYVLYTSVNGKPFDAGRPVDSTVVVLEDCRADSLYAFRICAVNAGGESFPSEELSLCRKSNEKGRVLVVNAFDRTGGTAWFEDSAHAGYLPMVDQGVPWHEDLHTVGWQYDYRKDSPWLDDDSPGHGASYADLEDKVIPGNSFDFSHIHGQSIVSASYSFASVSDEAFGEGSIPMEDYDVIDLLAGEEKSTYLPKNDSIPMYRLWTEDLVEQLDKYLSGGGNVFVSGAHIASDMHHHGQDTAIAALLKFRWRTGNASRKGLFWSMDAALADPGRDFSFNTGIHPSIYTVEGADALEPADEGAGVLLRYRENNMSAGVAWKGDYAVVALGFPFESIMEKEERNEIMRYILDYLTEEREDE